MSEGFLGVVNSVLTGPEAMQLESGTMLGQATQYTVDARQNPTDLSVGHTSILQGFPDVMPVGMIMI